MFGIVIYLEVAQSHESNTRRRSSYSFQSFHRGRSARSGLRAHSVAAVRLRIIHINSFVYI
jgi:hypothetical protein